MAPYSFTPMHPSQFLTRVATPFLCVSCLTVSVSGCDIPAAVGEPNSLIVLAEESISSQVEAETREVLEPTTFTSREEKKYEMSLVDPAHPRVSDLRIFRNVVVLAAAGDSLLERVESAVGEPLEPGRVYQAENVWARGQTVTAAALHPGSEVESWLATLPSVLDAVDTSYRAMVLRRMYATPPDTSLAADLGQRFGFALDVPVVYDRIARPVEDAGTDSLVILRNDNPDPSELIRSVLVTWRPSEETDLTREYALEWRAAIDGVHYNVAQAIVDTNSSLTEFVWHGSQALEVTGVWQDERGTFPAGGPFIVWLVGCGARTYFIDAWLYAPNQPKYEYMLQLHHILDSFRCVAEDA